MDVFVATLIDKLIETVPLIAAVAATILIAQSRTFADKFIRPELYPVLLPLAGAFIASVAQTFGVDIGDFHPATSDLTGWQTAVMGAIVGSATVGLNQIGKQYSKLE